MSVERLVELFRRQGKAGTRLGSPMYEDLCGRCADDVLSGGPVLAVFAPILDDLPTLAPLRLLGGVHRLVLERRAPALAVHYPSAGGEASDPQGRWAAFLEVCEQHSDELLDAQSRPIQTNEVGRAAVLVGGTAVALQTVGARPVRLLELGASAGLNLRADRFRVEGRGPSDSPVRLDGVWLGTPVPEVAIDVVERRGCDPDPVDPTSTEGRLALTSFVWPDDRARHERLRGALTVARSTPATVDQASALDWLRDVQPVDDVLTVLWHSVVRLYLERDQRAEWDRLVASVGARATATAPVAHLSLEPRGHDHAFPVRLTTWPGGDQRVLGTAVPHGVPVTWSLDDS